MQLQLPFPNESTGDAELTVKKGLGAAGGGAPALISSLPDLLSFNTYSSRLLNLGSRGILSQIILFYGKLSCTL